MDQIKQYIKKLTKTYGIYEPIHYVCEKYLYRLNSNHYYLKNDTLSFFASLIKEGDLCFDIGANTGSLTDIFLHLGAKVIAVEPQSSCMKYLKYKYKKNNNVILINKAVGEKTGESYIHLSENHLISSMSHEWMKKVFNTERIGSCQWTDVEKVKITTLDNLLAKYGMPSYCKIDVEGYEYEVLKGLSRPIKSISFEFTPEFIEPAISCIEHLSKFGSVKLNYSLSSLYKYVLKDDVGPREFITILNNLKNTKFNGDVYVRFI